MELTREMIEFIRQATWGEGRCQSAKLQEQGQEILRDIAKNLCRPTQDAPDLGESSAPDSESKPAPTATWVFEKGKIVLPAISG